MSFSFGNITPAGLNPNQLLDLQTLANAPQVAADVHQNRMLAAQTAQQGITEHDIAMTGQAAAPLLNLNEDQAAAAYPAWLQDQQSRGLAKYAPPTYPGQAAVQALVQRAMPILQQIQSGFVTPPGSADATKRINDIYSGGGTPPAAATSTSGGTNAPPGTSTPTKPQNLADIHPDLTQFTLPSGVGVTVAKSAAPQFQGLLTDLEAAGYKLDPNSTGGYNPRTIAGTNTPSQHAYGLAMDVNWQRNPRGANTPSDIPPDLARKLAAKWGLTWGGDWQGADRDPMHFEVARGTGPGTDHPSGVATGWNANNPMNLTADTGGVVTPGGVRLASFGSMADGVAATAAKLQSYQTDRGLDTVRKMYAEWHRGSPVNEADMQRIAGSMGVSVDQPFQLDPTKTAAWIAAAQPGETGTAGKRLSPADITAGVRQAGAGVAAPPGGGGAGGRYQLAGQPVAGPGGSGGQPQPQAQVPQPSYVDRETGLPVIGTQPGTPQATPQPQAQVPQPPANRVMPGSADGPPAPTPPPAQQQPPPGARGNLPRAADVPQGLNSPQIQQAQRLLQAASQIEMEAARNPYDKRLQADAAAKAADLKQRAQILMQTDSVVNTQEGQLHTLTGKLDDPAKPLADYRETSPGSGIWVGGPGTEPRFQPPGRLVVDPAGNVWQTSVGGAHMLAPSDPAALAARKAAEAAGTAAGTAAGKLPEQLANQGRDATQAIGNIDYGMSQIAKAKAGGVPTGYFAPWLGTIAAVGKSLGIPTEAIGVNPAAVGNIQTAQKTLAVVSGAILQQVLGSDSQITDAKIQHFIHAQPGIETDPEALSRVLNWARSQFVYEQEMARQGMKDASGTGMLPNNWRARYFTEHGFAPIYNPGTGEMQQPDGGSPSREPPATVTTAPVNPAARQVGTIYSTPKGPMKWIGNGWVAP